MSFLRTNEIATILRVSPSTARRLIDSGVLPAVKVGTLRRVDSAELAKFLNAHKTSVEPPSANPDK